MMNKGRNSHDYEASSEESSEFDLRRGPWTLEEDNLLIHYITCHGEGRWNTLAKCAGLKRTGKSCRLRWLNYLKPDIKRGNLSPQEQLLILELHSKWGNRWSKIAQHLPGRTDNEIKNYWRTRVQKQARQLNVDSNSRKFLEAIRSYWMPRLVEKMEQKNYSLSSHSSISPSSSSSLLMKNHSQAQAQAQVQIPHFEDDQKEKAANLLMKNSIRNKGYSDSSSADDLEIVENPTTISSSSSSSCPVFQTFDDHQYNVVNTIRDGCYHVDMIMEEKEGFEMSAVAMEESTHHHHHADIINLSEYDHHEIHPEVADHDHLFINGSNNNNMCSSGISSSSSLWNLDDLWHFRKSERWA